ncbi:MULTISPECIES: hypothetical protein [unclassified Streptomyces]|uniref:hypothetical protein n=1 Tax=unclassified Streptomyces TaxID=2593676 RepID=UPI0022B69832|nr:MULTISPECIES: hypothetical protein [unclassified Streptomyces]MCZ7413751.1 hypothetical protein [Streptomyces sp. WMMC897]MCZ7430747.1 hypothetical protein [Streptomyces sp. WMMC1477]
MTAPTPASPQPGRPSQPEQGAGQQPYDPWGGRPPGPEGEHRAPSRPVGPAMGRRDLWDGLATTAVLTAGGLLLGLLWWWLAPTVGYISDGRNAFLRNSESEASFGVQGTFVLLAIGVGVLCGALAFVLRRRGGVGMVLGLASGATLGSWVAAWFGGLLGPDGDLDARAVEAGRGGVFDGPLELSSWTLLLLWPLAALTTQLLLLAALGPREPQPLPVPQGWGQPPSRPTSPEPGAPQPDASRPGAPQHEAPRPGASSPPPGTRPSGRDRG